MRHTGVGVAVMIAAVAIGLGAVAATQPEFDTERWGTVRQSLFGDRPTLKAEITDSRRQAFAKTAEVALKK